MGGDYGDSYVFISAIPKHNTCKASLVLTLYIAPVMAGPQLVTQGCVYANRAESITNGQDFFLSVTCTEGESETAHLERLFMIYWFY